MLPRAEVVDAILNRDPALIVLHGGEGSGRSVTTTQLAEAFLGRHGASAAAVWVRHNRDSSGLRENLYEVLRSLRSAEVMSADSPAGWLVHGGPGTASRNDLLNAFDTIDSPLLVVLDHPNLDDETLLVETLERSPHLTFVVITADSPRELLSPAIRRRIPVVDLFSNRALAFTHAEVLDLARRSLTNHSATTIEQVAATIYRVSDGWPLAVHSLIIQHGAAPQPAQIDTHKKLRHFAQSTVKNLLRSSNHETRVILCASALFGEVSLPILAKMLQIAPDRVAEVLHDSGHASYAYWVDDSDTRWYRHHQLIRRELAAAAEAIIGPDIVREIYATAAREFHHIRPRYAVEAVIRAREWDLLVHILIHNTDLTLNHQSRPSVWYRDVPAEIQKKYPIIAAFALFDEFAFPQGRFDRLMNGLRVLAGRSLNRDSEKPGLPGITAATVRTIAARLIGDETLALSTAQTVDARIETLSDADLIKLRNLLDIARSQAALTYIHSGRLLDAEHLTTQIHERPIPLQDQVSAAANRAHAISLLAWTKAWTGRIAEAEEFRNHALRQITPIGWHNSYLGAGFRIAGALLHLEQGDPTGAMNELAALDAHAETIEHWPYLLLLETLVVETRLGPTEALAHLDHHLIRRRRRSRIFPSTANMLTAVQTRLRWQSGRALPRVRAGAPHNRALVYSYISQGEFDAAIAVASELATGPEAAVSPRSRVESLLLKADALRLKGMTPEAIDTAEHALAVMREFGLTLPLRTLPRESALQFADLIPEFPANGSARGSARVLRPLTPAEQRALIGVFENGSIRAAATALFLESETVRGYMKQVYRNLGVNSREEAIRVAGEAGLLRSDEA